jgi:hypothetical protein
MSKNLFFLLLHRGKNNVNPIEATQKTWKNVWYSLFYWMKFNSKIDKVFINVYKGKKGHIIFATLRKKWGLDLDKCIAFGSYGATTMVGQRT